MPDPAQLLDDAKRLIAMTDEIDLTITQLERECTEGRHIDLAQTQQHIVRLHGVCNQITSLASGLIDMAGREICRMK